MAAAAAAAAVPLITSSHDAGVRGPLARSRVRVCIHEPGPCPVPRGEVGWMSRGGAGERGAPQVGWPWPWNKEGWENKSSS